MLPKKNRTESPNVNLVSTAQRGVFVTKLTQSLQGETS